MRIHRALKIPLLEHPLPYALSPSYQDDSICVFTSAGSHQLKVGAYLIIGSAIFGLLMALLLTAQSGLHTPLHHHRYGTFPAWVLYPLGIFLLTLGFKLLLDAKRRSQIIIDRKTHRAQIQCANGSTSNSKLASITLTESAVITGPLSGQRSTAITIKQGTYQVVAIDVSHDCFVLGAFKSQDAADKFVCEIQELTSLDISEKHSEELLQVAGERKYLFQAKDKYALNHRKKTKPMQPVQFL